MGKLAYLLDEGHMAATNAHSALERVAGIGLWEESFSRKYKQ